MGSFAVTESPSANSPLVHRLHSADQLGRAPFLWKPSAFPFFDMPKRPRYPRLCSFTSSDIRIGSSISLDGNPWKVLDYQHVKPGKGAPYVRTKIRNQVTGSTVNKKFRAGCPMEEAVVTREMKQYSYSVGNAYIFMDLKTFEEQRIPEDQIGDSKKWLKEGMQCNLMAWNGRVIGVEVPGTVKLTVVETALPSSKGGAGTKPAELEGGTVVQVPSFIAMGDVVAVDTKAGKYIARC